MGSVLVFMAVTASAMLSGGCPTELCQIIKQLRSSFKNAFVIITNLVLLFNYTQLKKSEKY